MGHCALTRKEVARGYLQPMHAGGDAVTLHAGRTCSDGSIVQPTSLGRTSGQSSHCLLYTHQATFLRSLSCSHTVHRFKISGENKQ